MARKRIGAPELLSELVMPIIPPSNDVLRLVESTATALLAGVGSMTPELQEWLRLEAASLLSLLESPRNGEDVLREAAASAVRARERFIAYERDASGLFSELRELGVEPVYIENLRSPDYGGSAELVPLLQSWYETKSSAPLRADIALALKAPWLDQSTAEWIWRQLDAIGTAFDEGSEEIRANLTRAAVRRPRQIEPRRWLALLQDRNPNVWSAAYDAVGRLRAPAPELQEVLRGALDDADPARRALAAQALGSWGDRSCLPRIRELLDEAQLGKRLPDAADDYWWHPDILKNTVTKLEKN